MPLLKAGNLDADVYNKKIIGVEALVCWEYSEFKEVLSCNQYHMF